MTIKFVSYNGAYPCLCHGDLVVEVTGTIVGEGWTAQVTHERVTVPVILQSAGSWWFDEETGEVRIKRCPWAGIQRLPSWLQPYEENILTDLNKKVEHGCCGGCA